MGIKFSPGCACCCNHYVAFVHIISLGGTSGGQGTLSMATANFAGVPIDAFGFGEGVYAAFVSHPDLVTDCKLNVFSPDGGDLPLPMTAQVFYYGHIIQPPISLKFALPNIITLFASGAAAVTYEFGFYLLRGSRGAWEIVGGTTKLQQYGNIAGKFAAFPVTAAGGVL